jgi:predicted nucleic-acid-binding Zn-ribbon protein
VNNEGIAMTCKRCHSNKQSVFNGELAIHFPGFEGLNKHIVWVFPKLVVCLHCGFTEFAVPQRELQVLTQGSPVEGAVVLTEEGSRPAEKVRTKSIWSGMND